MPIGSHFQLKRVAADLGVTANSLRTWRDRAFGKGRVAQAASAKPKGREALFADPAAEIRRLQRESRISASPARDPKKSYEHTLEGPQGGMR